MGEQTTITVSQEVKDTLDEDRTSSWNEHLLELHENQSDIVRLDPEQIDEIARESAKKTIERA